MTHKQETYCYYSSFQLSSNLLLKSQRSILRLQSHLGEEWKMYANQAIYIQFHDSEVYLPNSFVFDVFLESWLQLIRRDNSTLDSFDEISRELIKIYEIQDLYYKPVMSGFYYCASWIWWKSDEVELPVQIQIEMNQTKQPTIYRNRVLLRPLAIVKERLLDYYYQRKKIQTEVNEQLEPTEELLEQFDGMDLNKKQVKARTKLNSLREGVSSAIQQTQHTYQVVQSFVLNSLEINQKYALLQSVKEQMKMRLLQPAQGFYNDLMIAWVLLRNQGDKTPFNEYLDKVKNIQGAEWNEQYIGPCQFFYTIVIREWRALNDGTYKNETEKTKLLFKNVKENMKAYWEQEIVMKAQIIGQQLQ